VGGPYVIVGGLFRPPDNAMGPSCPDMSTRCYSVGLYLSLISVLFALGCNDKINEPSQKNNGETNMSILSQRYIRLGKNEYLHSVKSLFPSTISSSFSTAVTFPQDAVHHGIDNAAETSVVNDGYIQELLRVSEEYSEALRSQIDDLIQCDSNDTEETCARQYLKKLATKAYRRPLDTDETTAIMDVYISGRLTSFDDGILLAIRAILISPQFVYRSEIGKKDGDRFVLTSYEIASAMSYMVTGRAPDDLLLADASKEMLFDPDVRESHVRRLFAKAGDRIADFFLEWLHIKALTVFQSRAHHFLRLIENYRRRWKLK